MIINIFSPTLPVLPRLLQGKGLPGQGPRIRRTTPAAPRTARPPVLPLAGQHQPGPLLAGRARRHRQDEARRPDDILHGGHGPAEATRRHPPNLLRPASVRVSDLPGCGRAGHGVQVVGFGAGRRSPTRAGFPPASSAGAGHRTAAGPRHVAPAADRRNANARPGGGRGHSVEISETTERELPRFREAIIFFFFCFCK